MDTITLQGVPRPALTPPFPSQMIFSVIVPQMASLEFFVGLVSPHAVRRARVEFVVELQLEGQRVTLYREAFRAPKANRWHRRLTDLSAWGGKKVDLILRTEPALDLPHIPWAGRILTAWGDPVLRPRTPRRGQASERPSFVFLLVDTLRADYLGAYGFEGEISPAVDRLALESLLFENCYTNAPWTKPAIATLFTSLHPELHGVRDIGTKFWNGTAEETEALADEALTLAESLRAGGYRTAGFTANPWISPRYGFAQGFEVFELHEDTKDLLATARRWLAAGADRRPFFLYLHFMDVHGPYRVPRADYEALLDSPSLGNPQSLDETDYEKMPPYLRRIAWASEEERRSLTAWRAKYAAGVRVFDRYLGPFLDELRNSATLDDAYVILTSDHGEELMEHGGWDHGYKLFDHQLHVPLLIRRPRGANAGRRLPSLVSLVDVMPTILSLAGIDPPLELQGEDFSKLLEGAHRARPDRPAAVFSAGVKQRPNLHGLRTREHKLVLEVPGEDLLLFDLTSDPAELDNVASRQP
ncbi:MAG: sulfatase, partial [Acidobacteriota bacterium]